MKKTLFHKLKMNKAYTLVEMMIVIAITVILLGISIVGISSLIVHLKMTELDEHAKTIYLEAQDQLGVIEAEGALDAYYESIRAAYPVEDQPMSKLRFLREIYPNGEYVSDYPKDDPMATKMWQNMCYLTRDDELSAKLISHTSDIYNNGGSYLIEFNPKTGDIYGVFYWESDEEISYGTDILGKSRTRADRTDARIGYYGGAIAGVFTEDSYQFDQKTTLINGEELYVKISFAKTEDFIAIDNDTLRFEVKVEDNEGNEVIIAPENTVVSRVDATERVEFYILLDSMYDGYRFNDIVNNGQAPENQTITPGEDISVTVITKYLLDSGYEEQIETFVEGNSLFGKDTNEETICISALRHMLNMNDLFYDATQFADRTKIQYLSDVDFEEEAYSWEFNAESKLVYKGYGKAKRPVDDITPIKNDALFVNHGIADGLKLTGKFSDVKYVLHNFVVIPAGGQTENVGIFEEFHNVDVSNIYVENVTVNAAGCDNVGGLAGYMQDGSIKGCGVYLATSGLVDDVRTDYCMMSDTVDGCVHLDEMEHRYETFKITGENKVGGLVGYIEGNYDVSIENAFAAIKVEGTGSYIGGLVGYVQIAPTAMGVTIEHTYTSGDVSGQNYVGGFAGGIIGVDGPSYKVYVRDAYATGNVSAVQKFAGFVGQSNYVAYSTCTSYGKVQKFSAISGDAVALVNEDIVGGFVCDNPETNVGSSYVGCAYMTQIGYNKSEALKNPTGVEKKDYTDLLSTSEETSVNVSYPYASELYLQAFPYVKLANQNSHYGNWPKRFIIDTSLVYYERYEDNSYGYYCVTTVENDENIWLLDTLKNETCVEDGYGLLTKYNLGSISYDLYIGNRAEDSEGNSVIKHGTGNVLLREEVTIGDPSIQGSFLRLNQQGTLQFREIASYDAEYGVEGTETGDTFDVTGLYLYQLPYELQCTDRKGVEYFYDRIIFNATGYGSNKQVIKDLAYLYCPHFAKTAFNPNITGEVINLDTVVLPNGEKEYPVAKPANVFVRSARQLNALGRFSYYWNTRHGLEDEVNYFQETDINFSTYVKEYGGYEFDLQAFDKSYSNRPIGDSEKSVAGETEYAGAFKNNYDGQGYKIIDYCLSVSDVQFVGLFGEIQEATLKNIIMVKSSNPASENAGMITSDFKTWISYGDTTRRREFRASVGALLGMAYDNSYCDVKSNEISNCMASGYTVQYVMNSDDNPLMYTKPGAEQLDPLGVVLGGLIGYGESHISNCAAVNDIVLVMEKDYTNSFDYYYHSVLGTYHLKDDPDDEIYGGIVNMGGFVGSYIYNKIENCYSGGTISIIDNGYKLPNLRVGNFCAGWLDTRAYGLAYTDYQKDGAKYNKSCSTCYNGLRQTDVCKNEHEKCNQLGTDFKSYEYVNCYTYTTVSESVWDVDTDSTNYVPFASNKVDYFDRGTLYGEWDIAQVIPIEYTTYENAYYLSELIDFDRTTEEYADKGTALTHEQLIEKTTINAAYTYAYAYEDANGRYPYQAVVTDHEGNYVHYGDWPTMIDASIVYYEKYADGSFGYYGVVTGINGKESWVLDTLRDRICIEDGYGLLSKYQLDRVNYILDPGNDGEDVESLKSYVLDLISAQQNIRYKKYESYNEIIGEAQGETGISIGMGTGYLYQLPYDLQFTERTSSFYDRIVFSAAADGKTVINYLACMYNPHFAKAAITSVDGKEYHEPTSIFVRSARQLNALGRNPYYWDVLGGTENNDSVTFIQETDINFSTYAGADKMYCGKDFDLQDFTKEYRNTPIGEPAGRQFKNAYDGRSNAIIDYCVSASDKQFVGLFGEIAGATLKNIVMLVSSNPSGDGGKIISSYQVKESTTTARAQRTGVGALVGLAYEEKPMQRSKTQIQNCAVSGYTVQYVLESDVIVNNPFGVAIGGLVGFSMSDISDSSATNNVVMKLERNYDNTFAKDKKGLVYMGGFVGSHMYNTIENCYSGGRISVDNKNGNSTYSIPYLRIGGFCPGWLDTNAGSSKNYTHYKANTSLERKVTYTNIYSYTKVADSVWDIPTGTDDNKFTQYIPLVSNLVEYCSMESREWKTESIADTHISFANDMNVYLEELTFSHMEKVNALATAENDPRKYYMNTETGVSFTATEKTTAELQQLAEAEGKHQVTIMPGHTHTYLYGDMNVNGDLIPSEVAYPYPAVIYKVDEAGNKTDVYSHYGDWYSPIENLLVYYEKYEDGFGGYTYGYYSVVNDSVGNKIWVLNTLKDKACVEDGYAILTKYELDNISYDMYQGQGSLVTNSGSGMFDMIHTQEGFAFESYEGYDALIAKPQVQTDDSILVGKMYLYQLPFALQNTNRTNGTKFYDLLVLSATEDGETVIDGLSSWYNPHFAKTAINASKDITYSDPTMIYVRSARQLNLLGRYPYYWNGNYGLAGGAKVTYIQETDINFSTYVKEYAGNADYDLQAFGEPYSNHAIGESYGIPFSNIYDGRSNKIVDYCLDGGEDTHFTGLFGEIKNATLKNIVMVVSSNPEHKNAGLITSSFRTQHYKLSSPNKTKRESRAGLGALLGMANIDAGYNTIENCAASGYTVKFVLKDGNYQSLDTTLVDGRGDILDPLGIAVGGLIGYSTDDISNCAAVNDVVIELKKDYQNTYDNYINRAGYNKGDYGTGGVVYLGGFIGSFYYGKIDNCYSGGTIDVINNGYSIPRLRVGGFCPGWVDTPMCGYWFRHFDVEYENIYSYTKVSERVWGVPGKKEWDSTNKVFTNNYSYTFTHYIPLVSRLVDYYEIGTGNAEYWLHDEVLADNNVTFNNNFYLDVVTDVHLNKVGALGENGTQIQSLYTDAATSIDGLALKQYAKEVGKNVTVVGSNTHTYPAGDFDSVGNLITSEKAYPYPAVIYEVDEDGNPTDTKVHYGDWVMLDTELVYYEEYEDGSYGYHGVISNKKGDETWVLDTLKDQTCVEDGYAILTKYQLDTLTYKTGSKTVTLNSSELNRVDVQGNFLFTVYEEYDDILGEGKKSLGELLDATDLYKYLYKLPYELQFLDGIKSNTFYDAITFSGAEGGETVISDLNCRYNPHFAKAALNLTESRYATLKNPTNVYLRSARHLNALGRYGMYSVMKGGSDGKQQISYIQETDINFSTYVKEYLGHEFDLQAFGKSYSNHSISVVNNNFSNIYDGRSKAIIDYCLDGTEERHTGLFGELNGATLKNIVMVVSSNPASPNAGLITSSYGNLANSNSTLYRLGIGALVGHAFEPNANNTTKCKMINTIENCVVSGYTVRYEVAEAATGTYDAIGVSIGGLIGLSMSNVSNCEANNNVVIDFKRDLNNIHSSGNGVVVNMGGFAGGHSFGKIENCYSGGSITVLNDGKELSDDPADNYLVSRLNVGGFCPGWMDAGYSGTRHLHYKDRTGLLKTRKVEYTNIYSYTAVSDSIWKVPSEKDANGNVTKQTIKYVPLVSKMVYASDRNLSWSLYELADTHITFSNDTNFYLEEVTASHLEKTDNFVKNYYMKNGINFTATEKTCAELEKEADNAGRHPVTVIGDNTHTYLYGDLDGEGNLIPATNPYPYAAVVYNVDEDGKKTDTYVHYGDWARRTDGVIVYYEKYADGTYGYYGVMSDEKGISNWILDTLRDETCIEDGHGILTQYELESIKYKRWPETYYSQYTPNNKMKVKDVLKFSKYKSFNDILAKGENLIAADLCTINIGVYLYKLPYELQNIERLGESTFYERLQITAEADGETVIDGKTSWYNPHFARAALNLPQDRYDALRRPANVYVRSARQLNALGRNSYYWALTGGSDWNQKVTFVQETDINFSTYVKEYMGQPFDLQSFGETYSNCPIGNPDLGFVGEAEFSGQFKNIYDGRSNLIIDYCVDGGSSTQFTGLFGEIYDATLKNIVMVTSANAQGNAGIITSSFRTTYDSMDSGAMRAGVGALVGLAYEMVVDGERVSNTITNCVASGYTVGYKMEKRDNEEPNEIDPIGIAIGGLIGFSMSDVSDSAAVNDVVIDMYRNYDDTYSTYKGNPHSGNVYMGGFIGSHAFGKVNNCYSGGEITVLNDGEDRSDKYAIEFLRIAGFCPGWLDTPAGSGGYKDFKNGVIVGDTRKVEYNNIYTYTTVNKNVWTVPTGVNGGKFTHYIPLVSSIAEYYSWSKWLWVTEEIPETLIAFNNNYYLDELSVSHMENTPDSVKTYYDDVATGCDSVDLIVNATHKVDKTFINAYMMAPNEYPYQAVIYEVDKDGNKTDSYVHYGEWLGVISNMLVYYEKYADGTYGYYSVYTNADGTTTWILNTLRDEICIEDGHGVLSQHKFDSLKYTLPLSTYYILTTPNKYVVEESLSFNQYESYDDILGKGEGLLNEDVCLSGVTSYLYKLPYELQNPSRQGESTFYERLQITAEVSGVAIIDGKTSWYNPHFAKTALNLTQSRYDALRRPANVYVRSARQLNALGGNAYYWALTGGSDGKQKVTYVQETDINFSTYVKEYLGQPFDLQAFGETYSNSPIGIGGGKEFINNYDGQSNAIIDYCVDGGSQNRYVGLFGEIREATLKNIVMVVSSNPASSTAGLITTGFRPRQEDGVASVGLGALVGSAFQTDSLMENCAVSGYTVKYELKNDGNYDPISIAIGGLAGFSMSEISNCTAANEVVMAVQKDYTGVNIAASFSGEGTVYLGGLVGSQMYKPVTDSYSGGKIELLNGNGVNRYRIPYLRVGGICPGWLDIANSAAYDYTYYMNDQSTKLIVEYKNVYSYTEVSDSIWSVDSTSTVYVPLVSNLVDYCTTGVWQSAAESKIRFDKESNYYLEEVTASHLQNASAESKAYYMNGGVDFAATQTDSLGLIEVAANSNTVTITGDNTHTYLYGDVDGSGTLVSSGIAYPYPAVVTDADTGDYVHYGKWPTLVTENSPISRYPVYYEEYVDGYGFWYVDEAGVVHSNLATVNSTEIKNAGYGYLTIFQEEATEHQATAQIGEATYYLSAMDTSNLETAYTNAGRQNYRYETFDMTYTRGEAIAGPGTELFVETKTLSYNPYYGAALCVWNATNESMNLGSATNPLQIRTEVQFENLSYTSAENAYFKQTHDIDLKYSNTPTTIGNGIYYDGSIDDDGCVIKNAGDTLFEWNSGEIRNVRVVSFDSTQASKDVIAGFVLDNYGVIQNCSIAGRNADEQVLIQGENAYGFVRQNTSRIENCTIAATIKGTTEAAGFANDNIGSITNCIVVDTFIEAADVFGFTEKNKGSGSITQCTVTAKLSASNKAIGFIEQNHSTLSDSIVYLADSIAQVAIEARKSSGFADENSGTITNCKVLPVEKGSIVATENSNGFIEDNDGCISNCYVGNIDNAKALHIDSNATYGFIERNNKHATITNCYVVAHLTGVEEAAGFVDINMGKVTLCTVGNKDSNIDTIIEAGDAFGFAEKNLLKGENEAADAELGEAIIHQCTAAVKIESSYKAVGFIEENQNVVTESVVYLKDSHTNVAINGESTNGFVETNLGTISDCNVISLGKATIVGITEADGFARENKGSISDCSVVADVIATGDSSAEACGFIRYNKGSISNCHVGDKANAEMMNIKGIHSYGFAKESGEEDADNTSVKIENCSVVANLITSKVYFAWNNSDAAYGFVGTNWGLVDGCQVGDDTDTEGKVEILIQGSRAYGFARENRGTITGCSVVGTGKTSIIATATPNATGNLADGDPDRGIAIGFVSENYGIVENSNVSAMNGYDTILIQGEQAVGFIHRNREATASITGCNVEATVKGELFAIGFVLSNSGKITNCSVEGKIIAADIAAGFVKTNRDSIDNCHVYTELVQGRLAYGFARQNGVEEATATIQNSDVHAKNDYSDIIIRGSERAYGFIGTNWGTVKYCFAVATVEGEITAAGFVAVNENTINNCYANAIVSVSSTNTEAYAGGFARLNNGTIKNSYACGTLTGYTTYGFTNSLGTVTSCYTIVDQDGTNMYGFSASGTPSGCYWGYEGYFNYNAKVARNEYLAAGNNESKITGHKLSLFDNDAEDSVAYAFSEELKNNKYLYRTYGLTHYGDWPLPAHFHQDVNAEDLLRAGLYYGEEYQDAVTGEWYRGVYAVGDYYYKTKNVRVIGQTINTLMKGDPKDVRKAYNYRCYYGVYYNVDIAAPDWKVNWKFVENGVESAVGTPSPNGIFKNLTEGYVPPNYDTYKFCELKDITDAVLNGTDVKAMATIFYKTNTYGGAHTDTNYNYGKFYYEDETKIDATNGVTLTITLEEVEAARKQ